MSVKNYIMYNQVLFLNYLLIVVLIVVLIIVLIVYVLKKYVFNKKDATTIATPKGIIPADITALKQSDMYRDYLDK